MSRDRRIRYGIDQDTGLVLSELMGGAKNKEESEKYYLMAVGRDKKDFQIYYGLYELYRYRFEDSEKALQTLYDGFENNPDDNNFVNELTNYLLTLDRRSEAEELVEEYISTHPDAFSIREKLK